MIPIVNLTPVGKYADNSPQYSFHCSLPTRSVRQLKDGFPTKEEAKAHAEKCRVKYEQDTWPGGMFEFIGVVQEGGKFFPVVNSYYSNS